MEPIEKLKNKRILVTGGAGFIGSNLCHYLVESGSTVKCLDNFSTGYRHNIVQLLDNKNFHLIEGDIRDLEICKEATKNVDFVLHQAALGSVPRSIKDPKTSNEVNVDGFLNILIASKENNVQRFVYAASSSTYGDSELLPKVESKIGNPLSPYAVTKLVNELYANIFKRCYNFDTIGLRYFNVFGPKQDPNGAYAAAIPLFIKKLIQHQSPIINGDGTHSRDFTYIENVVQMNVLAMLTDDKNALNQVYNTAVGERTSLLELVEILKKYLSAYDEKISLVEIVHGPEREGDIPHSLASIDKAKKLLNYQPSYKMEDGINKAISWYWENLSKND